MKPKLLDLFSGAGGAARGYQLAGFHVTGIDIKHQPRYIGDAFYQADALAYVAAHGHEYDVIHASPPCQKYTGFQNVNRARYGNTPEHPDLIDIVRALLTATGKPYIIENVQNAPLNTQIILCGAAFGLQHLARHRHFESNALLSSPPRCCHRENEYTIGIYGERPDGRRVSPKHQRLVRCAKSLDEARQEMGIDWMEWNEITQAIPPAYTQWIGERLLEQVMA